jgi:flagellar M-ring protein FliF
MESTASNGQLTSMVQAMERIPGLRQGLLLLAIAASVALGVVAALWSINPMYTPIAAVTDPAAASTALKAAGIKVMDRGEQVLVEAGRMAEAESLLGEQGLIPAPSGCGSMLEQKSGLGVVTMETERLQHRCMLQAELAQLISEMRPVRSARVVIGSGKQTVFVRDRMPTTASVFVELYPGAGSDESLVSAIVNTVSNGVPGLAPSNINVTDQHGRPLNTMTDPSMALSMQQMRIQQRIEMEKERKIQQQLNQYIGMGNYTATVTADVDFTMTEETSRSLSDPKVIGRSETVTERTGSVSQPLGIPGAISNAPPGPGAAAAPADPAPAAANADGEGEQTETQVPAPMPMDRTEKRMENLATGETIRRVENPAPRITRLAIAIALNDALMKPATPPAEGATSDAGAAAEAAEADDQAMAGAATAGVGALREEDVAKIEALIRNAVGFDAARGDTISIATMPFRQPRMAPLPSSPWWQNTFLMDLTKQALGALFVLVLFFTTVRPMIARLLADPQPALPGNAYAQAALTADENDGEAERARQRAIDHQDKLDTARQLAAQDPTRVANMLSGWVTKGT